MGIRGAVSVGLLFLVLKGEAAVQTYFEPEIGIHTGTLSQIQSSEFSGWTARVALGITHEGLQIGPELGFDTFFAPYQSFSTLFTRVPIGLGLRWKFKPGWRVGVAYNWDDVLYKDFRIQFQQGLKLPKDYDLAFEGPGSWRLGCSYEVSSNQYVNLSISPNQYRSFKRRHPTEIIGDVNPGISLVTWVLTVSRIF